MSVDSIQSSELYTIRAKRQEQTERVRQAQEQSQARQVQETRQAEQAQQVQQSQETQSRQVDTYDKENPVGVQAEGIYSLAHDEEGNLTVNYVKPSAKSEDTEETGQASQANGSQKSEASQGAQMAGGTQSSSSSSSDDDELEELQQQRDAIRQQLNREQDENVKAQLRTQLQSVEAEIIQLKAN